MQGFGIDILDDSRARLRFCAYRKAELVGQLLGNDTTTERWCSLHSSIFQAIVQASRTPMAHSSLKPCMVPHDGQCFVAPKLRTVIGFPKRGPYFWYF